ncbi:SAM-dependent methyltransferase [Aurantiacibacter poecillastricola]|uniref:SAM-dependent methyltransferase n=1 Tax=Aurantiacibacter poecillastricola TaxID=3064385 RepID=UPI00273F9EEF|nr:methyltransferase domain-containing protein [Aurantiacibacter sp. 219JJ12-13]MDP5262597.1 methyltransferase domain-containing protein [Aurantiacibacter sp. 219JJ12-13]
MKTQSAIAAPLAALAALALSSCVDTSQDIHYIPTPEAVVEEMLRLAEIEDGDVLYDLGSGDGRIVIAAARDYGIRAVGIEIDDGLLERARENARAAGVEDLVEFRKQDMFETDLTDVDVLALYLGTTQNLRLRPRIMEQMEPGSQVVSHAFSMGGWQPDVETTVENRKVFKWTVPLEFIDGFPPVLPGDGEAES